RHEQPPDRRVQHVLPGALRPARAERALRLGQGVGRDARRAPGLERDPGLVGDLGQAAELTGPAGATCVWPARSSIWTGRWPTRCRRATRRSAPRARVL